MIHRQRRMIQRKGRTIQRKGGTIQRKERTIHRQRRTFNQRRRIIPNKSRMIPRKTRRLQIQIKESLKEKVFLNRIEIPKKTMQLKQLAAKQTIKTKKDYRKKCKDDDPDYQANVKINKNRAILTSTANGSNNLPADTGVQSIPNS